MINEKKRILTGLILLSLIFGTGCDLVKDKMADIQEVNTVYAVTYLPDKEKGVLYPEFSLDKIEEILVNTSYKRTDASDSNTYRTFQKEGDGSITLIQQGESIENPEPLDLPEAESGYIGKNVYLLQFKNPTTNKYHATLVSGDTVIHLSKTDKSELINLVGQILKAQI